MVLGTVANFIRQTPRLLEDTQAERRLLITASTMSSDDNQTDTFILRTCLWQVLDTGSTTQNV